ncbi:MAG: tetratricopeptide repeat protein [Chitinophagales bacterium]
MKIYKIVLILCFLLFGKNQILAQETSIYSESNLHLKKGFDLLDQKLYLPAQKEFELLHQENVKATDNNQYTLLMMADFYYAICAARLNSPNTELLFTRFIENYHQSTFRNKAFFEMGSYYFKNNKSTDAMNWYEKVDPKELNNEELIEYKFNFAYSYFKKKKFDEAKPLFKAIKDAKNAYAIPAKYYYGFINFYEGNYKEAESSFEDLKDNELYKNIVPYYLCQIYFLRDNHEKVISYATPLVNNPKTENLLEISHILGQAHFELGHYEEAVPYLEAYIKKADKLSKEELYQLAYAQYKTGKYKDAIENFQQLDIVKDSLGQNAMYCLADCYLKTKEKAKAKDAFQQASSLNFDPFLKEVATFQNAKLAYELDFTSQAIDNLSKFLEAYPNSAYANEAGNLLSQALLETKNFSKAIEILEKYKITGASVEKVYQIVCYYRAVELYNDKQFDAALVTVNKSLKKTYDNDIQALAFFLKGNILYEKEEYADAASNFSKFKQFTLKDKFSKDFASKTIANYNIAYCNFKLKNYDAASSYFEETIKSASSVSMSHERIIPDAYLRNADCLFMSKSYTRAIYYYDELINKNWVGAEYALIQKSVILGLQGNFEEKVSTLEYLNSRYPNNIYKDLALYEMGNAYFAAGNFQKAISKLNSLTTSYPSSIYGANAYLKLGLLYFNIQEEELALKAYKRVVLDYKNTDQAKEALTALKELYISLGRPNDYVSFIQNEAGINISTSEQDSLLFEAAETQYMSGNCAKAKTSLDQYISSFPKGNFILNAYYFRADCQFKDKDYAKSYLDFKKVISFGASKYLENSLLRASYIAYEINANYAEALSFYQDLKKYASVPSNQEIALVGLLRCQFHLKNYEAVLEEANKVLANNALKDELKTEASFYKAKALMAKGNFVEAESYFKQIVNTISISSIKAESAYNLALILHKKYLYQASLDECFKVKDEYASYEYWLVKTFILIADNYSMLDNVFQAKATLQSIVDNYVGDPELMKEAKDKLDKLKETELKNTKVDLQLNNADTIEFDNN